LIVRSTLTLPPYAPGRPSLIAEALRTLLHDQLMCLDVDWEHRLPPFEVKYLEIERSEK
jgi:hypothetical protein